MNKVIISLFIVLYAGCNKSNGPITEELKEGLLVNRIISTSGMERTYHLYVPPKPTNAAVVVVLHGHGGSSNQVLGLGGTKTPYKLWLDIAERENLILAIPNGELGSENKRGWNDCRTDAPTNPRTNDVAFVEDLLNFIESTYNSNSQKVYVIGTSNGGQFAIRLAHEIPERITAFASVVASNAANSVCPDATTPVSALFMNGTADPITPYNGGAIASNRGEVVATAAAVAYWVERNNTNATPEVTNLPNVDRRDKSTVTKYLYKNGDNNTQVVLYKVTNGGHTEPSKTERYSRLFKVVVGNQNGDIEMVDEVWEFFKGKSR